MFRQTRCGGMETTIGRGKTDSTGYFIAGSNILDTHGPFYFWPIQLSSKTWIASDEAVQFWYIVACVTPGFDLDRFIRTQERIKSIRVSS